MSSTTFILLGVTYYVIALIIVIIVLNIINKKENKKYQDKISSLERDKNLIISAGILTELNKVEGLINNETMQVMFNDWKDRFNKIKNDDIPKISDDLIQIEDLYKTNKYKELKEKLAKTEYEIYFVKTKSNYLLNEIKEITLSEDRNRDSITKLKAKYRELVTKYNNNKNDYNYIMAPVELQFENVDKLFSAFEIAMENNNYQESSKIVKALEDIIGNLALVIEEAPGIILMGQKLIPTKMKETLNTKEKMEHEGFNLDYLNIDYNASESAKKVTDILEKLNVLNIEDSTFELKTILDYFENLYNEFDKERVSKKVFEDYMRTILVKANKYDRINNDLNKKIDEFKYSYDLTDEDVAIIGVIKNEIKGIKNDYDEIVSAYRTKSFAYSRLAKEMEILNGRLVKTGETLEDALKSIGGLKEDEIRAREQLIEIKEILRKSKLKINSYKLPTIPKDYYVELAEATEAIKEMIKELNKKPISIKTLNVRVDTARDLVLKLNNTASRLVKTAYMAEMAVVYGNRFRATDNDIDISLTKSENLFKKGLFKEALETSIKAINVIEPDFYDTLKSTMESKEI
jgi:septation ring formation regulator